MVHYCWIVQAYDTHENAWVRLGGWRNEADAEEFFDVIMPVLRLGGMFSMVVVIKTIAFRSHPHGSFKHS